MFCFENTMIGTSKSIWGFDPQSIAGCTIWLDGKDPNTFTPVDPTEGTTIDAWRDKVSGFSFTPGAIKTQSSNGTVLTPVGPTYVAGGGAFFSNATQAIGNYEQALGIYRAGALSPLFFVPNQNMTMIIASSPTSNNTLRRIAQMGTYPTTANPNFLLGPQMGVSEGGSMIFDVGPAQLNYSTSTATYSTAIGLRVDTMISAPGAREWWWTNGVLNTFTNSNVYTSTFSNYPVNFFFLGAYTNTVDGNRCFLGNIYEVLFYSNALTRSQRQAVEGYLANKWGFKASLPATNPFKVYPPLARAFSPTDIPGCSLWLDGADNSSMNDPTAVTLWTDKSGLGNNMTGSANWVGNEALVFNGTTNAFSNTTYRFPNSAYSMFAVYAGNIAPASTSYMNVVYGAAGYPMLGSYGSSNFVSARSVVANTGALVGTTAWTLSTFISSNYGTSNYGVATDPSGNVFSVAGVETGDLNIYGGGPDPVKLGTVPSSSYSYTFLLTKYTSTGDLAWTSRFEAPNGGAMIDVISDSAGNVYTIGGARDANFYGVDNVTIQRTMSTPNYAADAFIAKYTSTGTISWLATMRGVLNIVGVARDSANNVYVTGWYSEPITMYNSDGSPGPTIAWEPTFGSDVFIAKYTSTGTASWGARINAYIGFPTAIAADTTGNVFVTGYYFDDGIYPLSAYNSGGVSPARTIPATSPPETLFLNSYLVKYTTAGIVSWAVKFANTSDVETKQLAVDPTGNIYATGFYSDYFAMSFYNSNGAVGRTLASGATEGLNAFIVKYTTAGVASWATRLRVSPTYTAYTTTAGFAIATDPGGNVYASGYYVYGALQISNSNGTVGATLPGPNEFAVYIVKYTTLGTVTWATRVDTPDSNSAPAITEVPRIAVDASSNVIMSANFFGTVLPYNSNAIPAATITGPYYRYCGYIVKYTTAGVVASASRPSVRLPVLAGEYALVSATYTPSTFSPFVNGRAMTTLAGSTVASTGIYVGGPTNRFSGTICEILIYGTTLSAAQRRQVEGYLANKWSRGSYEILRAKLPISHPYDLIPPTTPQPAQYNEVTQGNWTRDWQPYLQSLAAANASGVTVTTTNITGGAAYTANGWFGGTVGPDGNIYFTPSFAANVLKLTVSTGVTTNITGGAVYTSNGWAGGVLGPDGNIYFAALPAANTLRLNVATGVTTNITGGAVYTLNGWAGGVLGPDGNIYFAPFGAANILRLNVVTGVTTNITGGATYTQYGWIGGVLGPDGNIYFAPANALSILRLNVATGVTTNITGGATFTVSGWQGGVLGIDGNIYFTPQAATNILRLNVATGVTTNITGGATYSSSGWYGGVLGPDGNIYCTPFGAANILRLNVATGVTTNITGGATFTANGWIGGVLGPDGNIYFGPRGATNILKLTFSGLSQLPSMNYCMSAYANKL